MVKSLIKNPLFVIGFGFVLLVFSASIIHWLAFDSYIPEKNLLYEGNKLVGDAPHTPSEMPPFGSDRFGKDYLYLLVKGAKVTIGFAFAAAFLRMLISIVLGLCYANFFQRFSRFITSFSEAMQYLPTALLAYIILRPVLTQNSFTSTFSVGIAERILFELIIFAVIAVPTVSVLIGNETKLILNREFITSVKVIGGGRWHVLRKHVLPHLAPKLWINFGQQVIQVLVLLVHLGLLRLFLGGTIVHRQMSNGYESVTAEWSGLIGYSYQYLDIMPWLPLVPLGAFTITILAMNYMVEGMKRALVKDTKIRKFRKNVFAPIDRTEPNVTSEDFEFLPRVQTRQQE